jgi:hypothetical protein
MISLKDHFIRRATAEYLITILIISVALTATDSSMQKSYAQTRIGTIAGCQQSSIATVAASGNDGNLPANVLDNNLNTRWSNLGVGSFIQADLGGQKTICGVDIAWYRGNLRVNNFVISVSNDGTIFTNVFTGKSSGTTLSSETYVLPGGTTGRYVRITVNGNTENNWASITELSVEGFGNIPQNNPPIADNKTIQTSTGTPVQITLTGTDPVPGDLLKFSVVSLPGNGNVTSPTGGPPNTVTYTPKAGFSGTDSFIYKATTKNGQAGGVDSNIATVTITVNAPPPPPPTANNINIQTNKETPIGITLTGTDPIPGDVLKFTVVENPAHGTITPGTVSSNIFYTPNTGFIGTDSFTYKATTKNGQAGGVDSNIATVTIIISNASSVANNLDPFGIREIYPTKASGEQWFMNMNDPNRDPRTDPKTTLTKNPDGSWKITSSAVRFQVFTSSGYHPELITTLNQQQMAAKGYMQSPNDWRDVEITGYVKLNKQGGDVRGASGSLLGGHYTWYARGGKHIGQGSPLGCEATSYHADWAYAGKTRFAKEQWHVSYVFTPYKPSTDSIAGKWVGFKTIMYNIQQNGKTAVKMEIWVDANNNGNWLKVNEFVDSGGFGKAGGECGGAPDQIITWGGPIATYRWDNSPDVDVKNLSVREIQPSLATH